MMETQNYWEDNSTHQMQLKYETLDSRSCKDEIFKMGIAAGYCEGNLNFATASEDDEIYTKKKVSRVSQDPMSHRIIEKRRRDRMNNCLADLSRLIPAEYLKKGRGRVEKTEIIEMAIRHMKYLQGIRPDTKHTQVHTHPEDSIDSVTHPSSMPSAAEQYRLGYQECLSETMNFLVEVEGFFARDAICVQLVNHLQQHCDKVLATNERFGFPVHSEVPLTNGTSFPHNNITSGICHNSNIIANGHHSINGPHNSDHHQHMNDNSIHHNINGSNSNTCSPASNNNGSSDHGSSSGVSSYGDMQEHSRNITTVPQIFTSDDSNHSNHSHISVNTTTSSQKPPNYKFKNSIKQRFSADQRFKLTGSPPPTNGDCQTKQHGVPIFALHDNGAFYIPLTVESNLLRPHLNCNSDQGPDAVLHPVTISVNFNYNSPTSWSQHSPPHHI